MTKKRPNLEEKKRSYNKYIKYSNIGLQMLIIIAAGAFGGQALDKRFEWETPVFTIILSLLAVAIAIILVIRSILNED